eukprot:530518-Pelagomonas_calceolata.AAC.1
MEKASNVCNCHLTVLHSLTKKAVEKQALSYTGQPAASWSPHNNGIQIQKVSGVSSEQLRRYAPVSSAHTHTLQNWCLCT